jgi:hypothetical protein
MFGRDDKFLYRYDLGEMQLQQYAVPQFMHDAQKIIVVPGSVYMLNVIFVQMSQQRC